MARPQALPNDRKFLQARTAVISLEKAIPLLRTALMNLDPAGDMLTSEACRKALVKAVTAHNRAEEWYDRERLRVASQLEMAVGP